MRIFIKIILAFVYILLLDLNQVTFASIEYANTDDPQCRDDCALLNRTEQTDCFKQQINFHTYRLVKSVFNYGKLAIYAGLWVNRYDKPDHELFERIFNETLDSYNNEILIGNLDYLQFTNLTQNVFATVQPYSNETTEYEKYPSLQCPTLCTYDILTWQTLLGLSIAIFVLALITSAIYSVYLHKQYKILKNRLNNVKYTKIIT